jgi:S1-C subfamily serine protease
MFGATPSGHDFLEMWLRKSVHAGQLIVYGKVMRPGLNVQLAPEPVARQLNVRSGALVLSVPGTSAAAKAGLKPTRRGLAGNIVLGDVIVAVGESLVS